jgi:putative NIF3 family GTP cyclohydrolase 1 type 2
MKPSLGRYANLNTKPKDLFEILSKIMHQEPQHFDFGAQDIQRVAWCTGAAQDGIIKAAELGADAYISGEVSERTFHLAKELGLHYYNVGHHASERFGVKALAENIAQEYDLQYSFIEIFNPV